MVKVKQNQALGNSNILEKECLLTFQMKLLVLTNSNSEEEERGSIGKETPPWILGLLPWLSVQAPRPLAMHSQLSCGSDFLSAVGKSL